MTPDLPRIALVQMEVRPGRPDLNFERMRTFIASARDAGVEIVAFPELCLPGYLLGDLWEQDAVVADFAQYSDRVRELSDGLTVMFGNVVIDPSARGEDGRPRKLNAVYVCHDQTFVRRPSLDGVLPDGVQAKTLHPNYRYFDDDRHFYSLRKLAQASSRGLSDFMVPFEVPLRCGRTFRFGVQLCEDIWFNDYEFECEVLDTLRLWRAQGAEAVFNLSSSPWTALKNAKRNQVIGDALKRSPLPFFYVNHVGAQNNGKNIMVYDGDTTAYGSDGALTAHAEPWREQMLTLPSNRAPNVSTEDVTQMQLAGIMSGIRHLDHVRGAENRYLVGVSGGVDSATVLALLVHTLGRERVFAVNMPTQFNSELTRNNAAELCRALDVPLSVCSIQSLYQQLARTVREVQLGDLEGDYSRLVDENLQARIRGADILAGLSARFGLVYTNNGNKTETALGYSTLYGDVNGAIAPIADLYKTEVFALARYLNEQVFAREVIPNNLLSGETVPSAELSEAQDVTKGLGDPIKYGYHDAVLRQFIEWRHHVVDFMQWMLDGMFFERIGWRDGVTFAAYFENAESWLDDLDWLARQLRINYFKRIQAPPIVLLSKRAFGFDLRESQLPAYRLRSEDALRERVLALDWSRVRSR